MKMKLKEKFDQLTLLELFHIEPLISNLDDGYWCYEVKDNAGTRLRFGINVIQESIQIEVRASGFSIITLSFELVGAIEIIDLDTGKFAFAVAPKIDGIQTKIKVELRPYIKIEGYTLRSE